MPAPGQFVYTPLFAEDRRPAIVRKLAPGREAAAADRAPPEWYVFDDAIRLRVNLALATGRPLLVRGPSGCGKSSLARAIAARAEWNYVERTIGSRIQAQDLLYEVDQLKRLQDAYARQLTSDERKYLRPGPLFWAFDAATCKGLMQATGRETLIPANTRIEAPWVVLIDEIDKADPDVPNNLLVPLGALEFPVPELGLVVQANPGRLPLVLITTNEEREMPPAFLRRCIELVINEPDAARLRQVAREHKLDQGLEAKLDELADHYMRAPRPKDQPRNTAEFLDFVRAWRELELTGDQASRDAVLEAISGRASD